MSRSLPPLSQLRAFEAVARHLSFTRAAEELHVTPGAVSQQIRSLEQLLGEVLFVRTKRSVKLTDAAIRMLPDIQAGFEALSRAVNSETNVLTGKTLTVSVAPSFASKWLVPRLPDFSDRHPEIDLRISATVALTDFRRDNVDLAIRFGRGTYNDVHTERLLPETVTPLCSPDLLKGKGRMRNPEDLKKHRLLHDMSISMAGESEQSAWERWLKLVGAKHVSAQRGTRFSLAELALQAAIERAGVVLGRMVLAESDIAAGRLVQPFKTSLPLDVGYFLVTPRGAPQRPELRIFRDWLYNALRLPPSRRTKT
jgi:LysR family transcriptional regulator, glycine cleavage system transcriptional activator